MSMPAMRIVRPRAVGEAVRVLADHGPEAMVIAGGTDVVPNLQMRLFAPRVLLDIKGISALRGVLRQADGSVRIGALTTLAQLLAAEPLQSRYSVLASAVGTIAGPLQRNMGTVGGNLCLETRCRWYNQSFFWRQSLGGCLKKDGPICHVAPGGTRCWAAWSGDSAPAFLTLEAEIEITGPNGARRIPLASFYRNDGMDRILLAPDELLTAVVLPTRTARWRGVYHKLRIRSSIDYPLAGVAVAMSVDEEGMCRDAHVAVTAVNPAPLLVKEANEWLTGRRYSSELVERVAHTAIQTAKPLTTSASTPVYRRDMLRLFTRRSLEEAWGARPRSGNNGIHAADR